MRTYINYITHELMYTTGTLMKGERVVNLEDVRTTMNKHFEELSRKSVPLTHLDQFPFVYDEIEEKDKEVLVYIENNPGIIKQDVVDAFEREAVFSRHVIFKILHRLEDLNVITVKPDRKNNRHHRLFVNDADIRVSLLAVLEYFKKLYLGLIYKTKPFIERGTGITLVESLLMLYKFTKNMFYDFFVFHGKLFDKEALHRKFEIHNNAFHEILENLYNNLVDINFIHYGEEMERFVNYSRSDVLGPENLSFIISSFEKCSLREYVEPIIDFLWRLFYRKLPLLYQEYSDLSREGKLNGWRDVVKGEFIDVPYKRKVLYCPPSN
jgi:hypothetical protein